MSDDKGDKHDKGDKGVCLGVCLGRWGRLG
jgi:hypothetical protein